MKRIITFLLTLVLTCCLFACDSCSDNKLDRKNPTLTDTSSAFASIKETVNEKEYTYSVTRGELYLGLKKEFGSSALSNLVDTYLLKTYYDAVEEDAIKNKIKEDVYGKDNIDEEGKVTLSEEKQAEAVKEFLETMTVSYGCNENDIYGASIMKKYRLSLAQKAYAEEKLIEEIADVNAKYEAYLGMTDAEKAEADEEDLVTAPYFADSKYASLYNADHVKEYTAIIVPFTTKVSAEAALAQINVTVKDGKWAVNDVELTTDEVVAKYIELYELVYGYKTTEQLTKDSEVFKLEASKINSNVANRLKDMENNEYYATPYLTSAGSLYFYVLKLAENEVVEFDDLSEEVAEGATKSAKDLAKEEYEPQLREAALTSTYILTKLAELRAEKNFAIYDAVLEANYVSGIKSYGVEYTETTDEKTNVVATVDGKEFTAEELFTSMCELGESAVLIDLFVSKRLLGNPLYNVYYQNGEWVDEDKKKDIETSLEEEKENFEKGTYKEYGFDPELIGWTSFLEGSYGVSNDEELKMTLLTQAISSDFIANVNVIEKHEVTKDENSKKVYNFKYTEEQVNASELWKDIYAAMQKDVDEYFSVKGIHLLVSTYESVESYAGSSNPLDPTLEDTKWTAEQKAKAKELCEKVAEFIADEKGTYEEKLEKIVKAYKEAPAGNTSHELSTITSNGSNPVTINLSEYKGYGLYVKWESLGTFTNGSMVEQFNDAVKTIWDADQADGKKDRVTIYENKEVAENKHSIETKYGYHVYVNLKSNALTYIDESETGDGDDKVKIIRYLPTVAEIRQQVKGDNLTSAVTSAISKYYQPYKSEIEGTYFISVLQYNAVNDLMASYTTNGNSTKEDVQNFLNLYVDYVFETNLKKVTKDFITASTAE